MHTFEEYLFWRIWIYPSIFLDKIQDMHLYVKRPYTWTVSDHSPVVTNYKKQQPPPTSINSACTWNDGTGRLLFLFFNALFDSEIELIRFKTHEYEPGTHSPRLVLFIHLAGPHSDVLYRLQYGPTRNWQFETRSAVDQRSNYESDDDGNWTQNCRFLDRTYSMNEGVMVIFACREFDLWS